ncbi:fructose-bisphosphatase class III [Desulfofustis limnaeus]|jgi:fructose-1,6-bisphosphatase-3|uniref:Fructose-1,6-bisphosphatase class 3 n=1 Tax=Desulfofustis limnaeus TaxID=2740163 RepID=A0ABM7W989_9BACT|nr:fructose-bisphosphatase class III [Desulfofustis limnaeus]MDX9893972.1 fructose-bisphosphatase class III [Desulfofustis sp.]BDD87507.1 fructose-1,6-bisphosphatase class 3 [Desulfofustis limnaeus]
MGSTLNQPVGPEGSPYHELIKARNLDELIQRLLQLDAELNSNIPTTLWISDLHGEGDRFKSILRGRFGVLYQTCREALPNTFTSDKIQYLARIIRKQYYIEDLESAMDKQDVILCLVEILKYKMTNVRYRVEDITMPEFQETIGRLLAGLPVPDPIFEEEVISIRLIHHLCFAIRNVLLDRIQVLGDVFDRGPQPDKIIRFLSSTPYRRIVDYVLGNHDILWMGAASGNRSLIAEAIRITCRYDHFEFMERMHFDASRLAAFAERTYPADKVTGKFKARTEKGRAMEKALAIIQFKLEEQTIRDFPEYDMSSRLWLDKLADLLQRGDTQGLNDTFFPTVDLDAPHRLTDEEQEVIDDLAEQFRTNRKLKRLLGYLFTVGKTYSTYNNILNIHALVPSTSDGDFEEFLGRKGRDLLDFIQATISRVGRNYLEGSPQAPKDQALFFYLWCGPRSPFFGKHAMKTFERYFLLDKETHTEKTLYWQQNLSAPAFKQKLLSEFGVKRVVYGHTPVNYLKGKHMASDDGVAINVDGGFAAAYYNRGHSLVHTPYQLYGIILPTPEEIKEAERKFESAPIDIELIDEFIQPMKLKHTTEGKKLKEERNALLRHIKELAATNGNDFLHPLATD